METSRLFSRCGDYRRANFAASRCQGRNDIACAGIKKYDFARQRSDYDPVGGCGEHCDWRATRTTRSADRSRLCQPLRRMRPFRRQPKRARADCFVGQQADFEIALRGISRCGAFGWWPEARSVPDFEIGKSRLDSRGAITLRTSPVPLANQRPRTYEQPTSFVSRVIRYSILVRNPTDKVVRGAKGGCLCATTRGSSHRLVSLRTTTAHLVTYDDLGNAVVHFKVAELGPHAVLAIAIEAVVEISGLPVGTQAIEPARYSRPDDLVRVKPSGDRCSRAATHDAVKFGQRPRDLRICCRRSALWRLCLEAKGALRTLQEREGDCTDYAQLVVALARAMGIPAGCRRLCRG